jgi:ATP-dependent exoDNAse (exonuclease V) beta subunit
MRAPLSPHEEPGASLTGAPPSRHGSDPARGSALTDEQEQAVARRREPLLLAAGAGSGKTSVLVERFVRAVLDDGVAGGRILAITFTERAAGELRERVRERFLTLGEREAARDTEAAFVSTFHGFCARLLRTHPLMAGLDPDFTILDEGLAQRMRDRAFGIALADFLAGEPGEAVDLVAAYGADRVGAIVQGVYAELRSRGQGTPRLPSSRARSARSSDPGSPSADDGLDDEARAADDAAGARAMALLDELVGGFGRSYEELKRARGAVDFDDLELRAGELLETEESVRGAWSERFELLMVDEFQDTNPRQLAILGALERGNLFTVGDELQSIYGFRDADVGLFRARRAELAERGGCLRLTENFRSRAPLLEVVNAVFEDRLQGGHTPLLAGRQESGGRGGGDGGEPLVELLLSSRRGWEAVEEPAEGVAPPPAGAGVPRWREAEARMLAERVAELVDSGRARPGDVAVLLRAVGDLDSYERALQDCGLKTIAAVGGFWGRQQVGDLLAYLRALANPLDELALYSTLASPLVGLSSDGLVLLARAARARGKGQAWATVQDGAEELYSRLGAGDADALVGFRERFERERRATPRRTIAQLIERAIDDGGYRAYVLGLDWAERRLANVHKLLRLARRFEASEGRDLRGFLDHVAHQLQLGSGPEPDGPVAGVEPDAIRLMSIHSAKGLEFPVVCIADLGRAQNLGVPDLLVDGDRVGLRLVRLDGAEATPALDFQVLCEERKRAQAEEEERILYVGMTRARERLLLSGAVDFERWPEPRLGASTISWLAPALAPELPVIAQSHLLTGGEAVFDLDVGSPGAASVRCRLNAPLAQADDRAGPSTGAASTGAAQPSRDARSPAGEGSAGRVGSAGGPGPSGGPGSAGGPGLSGGDAVDSPGTERAPSSIPEINTIAIGNGNEQLQMQLPAASADAVQGRSATGEGVARGAPPSSALPNEARPERIESLSYTTLSELERCGYRFYLERILRLEENHPLARAGSSREGLEARARGTLVHRLLESVDFARPIAPSAKDVGATARELGMRVGGGEREEIAELIGAVARSATSTRGAGAPGPAARIAIAEQVRREHPFAFSLGPGEPLVTGVIDLLAREVDGGVLVLDYKTDRVDADEDLAALVEREYGVQRMLYALAVLRDGATKVEVIHWFLQRQPGWVGAGYVASDRGELEERLAARVGRARERGFSVSDQPHRGLCETCPGRAGLCSWSEVETLREKPAGRGPTGCH